MRVLRSYHKDLQTIVEITGEFDRLAPARFLSIIDRRPEKQNKDNIVLDMVYASSIDSTFIGALSMLVDKATIDGVNLKIVNVCGDVRQILEKVNYSCLIY
jgi:anti-anti-sigma factor